MKNILKAELFKLRKSKGALICTIILFGYMLLMALIFLGVRSVLMGFGGAGGAVMGITGYTASSALGFFANDLQIVLILVCVVVCGFYAGEYTNGLIRNSLTVGVSRTRVFFSKFIMAMAVAAAAYCAVTFIYMGVYGIVGGWGDVAFWKFLCFWALNLLQFTATVSLVFFFSVLTKSTGATIGITIGLTFFFSILSFIALIGQAFDNAFLNFLSELSMLFSGAQVSVVANMTASNDVEVWRVIESVLVGLVTFGACTAGGWALFQRQDQK